MNHEEVIEWLRKQLDGLKTRSVALEEDLKETAEEQKIVELTLKIVEGAGAIGKIESA